MDDSTFITRVRLNNYKSIEKCDVHLRPLLFLVGPNGSGKSNFLDALRFVADALDKTLDHALRDRGGIKEVRRRSGGHPNHLTISLNFRLGDGTEGVYTFRIGGQPRGGYEVQSEEFRCNKPIISRVINYHKSGDARAFSEIFYEVKGGKVTSSSIRPTAPAASNDRLYLVNVSGIGEFRPLYDALKHMGFYNLNPDRIRDLQDPDVGDVLRRDGGNLASVLARLERDSTGIRSRIEEYMSIVVPGVKEIEAKSVGPKETIEFRQQVGGGKDPRRFPASSMSDGTLRALGVLVALFQAGDGRAHRVPLVGIEEPETALHPAAAGVLRDSLREASRNTQVIVTSHSPDLLDDKDISAEWIMMVNAAQGATTISPVDEAGRSAIKERLYTAGELLRLNALQPEIRSPRRAPSKPSLFATDSEA